VSAASAKVNLLDCTPVAAHELLVAFFREHGEPAYRANQVVRRLWQAPVATFDAISELPKRLRELLSDAFELIFPGAPQRTMDLGRGYHFP